MPAVTIDMQTVKLPPCEYGADPSSKLLSLRMADLSVPNNSLPKLRACTLASLW